LWALGSAHGHKAPCYINLNATWYEILEEDRHNAEVFLWCCKRMGEFIPRLVEEGKNPRIMIDYSCTPLHGLRQMAAHDVIDSLRTITCDPRYRRCVEWLGASWGHAVAPSSPPRDYRMHTRAWQHHFCAIFGREALSRVRGFAPSEMALPNHQDMAYDLVKSVKECGCLYMIVQEHSVERPHDGWESQRLRPHLGASLSKCPVPLADRAKQLLPLLGTGTLD